jgi:hypothetical protein
MPSSWEWIQSPRDQDPGLTAPLPNCDQCPIRARSRTKEKGTTSKVAVGSRWETARKANRVRDSKHTVSRACSASQPLLGLFDSITRADGQFELICGPVADLACVAHEALFDSNRCGTRSAQLPRRNNGRCGPYGGFDGRPDASAASARLCALSSTRAPSSGPGPFRYLAGLGIDPASGRPCLFSVRQFRSPTAFCHWNKYSPAGP